MLDRGDKDAITLLFAAVLNKGSMKVEQKRKEIKKAGLSGISIEESFAVRQILLFCQEKLCEKNAPKFRPQRINSRRFSDRAMPTVTSGLAMPPVRVCGCRLG